MTGSDDSYQKFTVLDGNSRYIAASPKSTRETGKRLLPDTAFQIYGWMNRGIAAVTMGEGNPSWSR